MNKLLESITLGPWHLKTRTAMAPMTRCFADPETGVVGDDVVEYYRKRAADEIGLIISEGVTISPRANGYVGVPGIYTDAQVDAWRKVTTAVHQEGGTMIAQIWHVGRISHRDFTGGLPPQAPSAIRAEGTLSRSRKPYDEPEAMSLDDIQTVIAQYAQAARNAIAAGFDGVEIHGAHGYLIDQFNSDISNHRTDRYGGDLAQRLTFMKEVISAVIEAIGVDRTVIRFSAYKVDQLDYMWEDPEFAIRTFMDAFREVGVKIIHPSARQYNEPIADGKTMHQLVRRYWDGVIIGVGDLNPTSAEQALEEGTIDLAAFGRPLLANPDFVQRIRTDEALVEYEPKKHLVGLV